MSMHRIYKGFELNAHALALRSGRYAPRLVITRHNADDTKESMHDIKCGDGYDSEDAAIAAAMDFGLRVVDGEVRGIDIQRLL